MTVVVLEFASPEIAGIATQANLLHAEIERVATEFPEAFEIDGDPLIGPLHDRLRSLAAQLPQASGGTMLSAPVADGIAWARVAYSFACQEKGDDGWPMLFQGDDDNIAVGNLVAAVLGFAGKAMSREILARGS